MTRYRRRPAALIAVALAALLFWSPLARAQVLDQVPADALVVVKIKNIGDVSKKVADFMTALGVAELQPALADPLGAAEQEFGIKQGVDHAGDLAFVFLDPKTADGNAEESMFFLVPVSDYKAFVGNFANAQTEDGVTAFKPENAPQEIYVAEWGKYAALSPTKSIVANAPEKGLKLTGLAAKEAETRDAVAYANIPALKELALPELEKARAELPKELAENEELGKFGPVVQALLLQYINVAEGYLNDAESATLSMNLSDDGISTTFASEFRPDTYMAKVAQEMKNTDGELITGLPDRKYFVYGGGTFDPETLGKLFSDFISPVQKELVTVGEEGKAFADALDSLKAGAGAVEDISFGYAVPSGDLGAEGVLQSIMVAKGDAKTIHSAQKAVLEGYAQLFKSMPAQGPAKPSFELEPDAETVGGVKFDRYKFNLGLDENDPQAAQAQMVMTMIFGPGGLSGLMAPVDDKTYLVVQGGPDKLVEEAVAAAKAGEGLKLTGTEGVKMVAGQLPAKRFLVEYIAVDNIVRTGVKYASAFVPGLKMQLPDELPPVGVSVASEGTAMRVDGFVPTTLVQSIVAASMQTWMQMQGGGGGGGPEGL